MCYDGDGIAALSAEECRARLAAHPVHIGRVAFVDDGYPVVLPVNHRLLDGAVVFRTGLGSRLDAALRGAAVSFQVDRDQGRARDGTPHHLSSGSSGSGACSACTACTTSTGVAQCSVGSAFGMRIVAAPSSAAPAMREARRARRRAFMPTSVPDRSRGCRWPSAAGLEDGHREDDEDGQDEHAPGHDDDGEESESRHAGDPTRREGGSRGVDLGRALIANRHKTVPAPRRTDHGPGTRLKASPPAVPAWA